MPDYKPLSGLRIARVSTVAFFVETQLSDQITALSRAGADVTVVASEPALTKSIPGATYTSIDIARDINLLRDLTALLKLFIFFRRNAFDIVHSTTPKAGFLCSIAARLARVPIRLHTYTGQTWVELTGLKRLIVKACDTLISVLNSRCYTDSISQKAFLVERGVVRKDKIRTLGAGSLAGVDLIRFNRSRFNQAEIDAIKDEFNIPHTEPIFLFVGRISSEKGIFELLSAFDQVTRSGFNSNLLLVGPKEVDIEIQINKLTAPTKKRIFTPGFSNKPEGFMAISDILVLPSYREGFGTVVIEAASMGLPCIGTSIYGLSDSIVDGETGILVPPKNVPELALAMERLIADPKLRAHMGTQARQRVEKDFSSSAINSQLIAEYADLSNKRLSYLKSQRN